MRCFIGLDLSISEKLALDSWRQQALPEVLPRQSTSQSQLPPQLRSKNGKKRHQQNFQNNTPATPYAVPAANFHITLCFVGDINHRQHEALIDALDNVNSSPFSLTLDGTGLWGGPKILFSAPSTPPSELMSLAKLSRKAARSAGIEVENREYKPHVTLVRKATATLPLPLYSPHVEVNASAFHLFESVSSPQGVSYPIRHSWALKHAMSVREKLRRGITDE